MASFPRVSNWNEFFCAQINGLSEILLTPIRDIPSMNVVSKKKERKGSQLKIFSSKLFTFFKRISKVPRAFRNKCFVLIVRKFRRIGFRVGSIYSVEKYEEEEEEVIW